MEEKFAKICTYALLIAILSAAVVTVATNNGFASAQACSAQLGYPNVYPEQYYYGGNFQVTVPVSVSCSSYTGQLYATGTAYDNGVNVGTANAILNPTYGGNGFSGQLSFTLPTSELYNSLQFSASIYSSPNGYGGGSLLAVTSSTFVLEASYYPSYPYNPYYHTYPNYPSYPSYPSYPRNPHNSGGHDPHFPGSNTNNSGRSCYPSSNCNNDGNHNNTPHPHHP